MFYEEDLSTDNNNKIEKINQFVILESKNLNINLENSDLNSLNSMNSSESEYNSLGEQNLSISNNCVELLNDKINELEMKINFLSKHSINVEPMINININKLLENFDSVIKQINSVVITQAQISPKPKTPVKKIYEYEY